MHSSCAFQLFTRWKRRAGLTHSPLPLCVCVLRVICCTHGLHCRNLPFYAFAFSAHAPLISSAPPVVAKCAEIFSFQTAFVAKHTANKWLNYTHTAKLYAFHSSLHESCFCGCCACWAEGGILRVKERKSKFTSHRTLSPKCPKLSLYLAKRLRSYFPVFNGSLEKRAW